MKNKHGSSKLVGYVAGMTARRVDTDYDEVTPARVLEAQRMLEPFLNAVRCTQIGTCLRSNATSAQPRSNKKKAKKHTATRPSEENSAATAGDTDMVVAVDYFKKVSKPINFRHPWG